MQITIETPPDVLAKLRKALDDQVRTVLRPRPRINGSDWANQFRILPAETATEPGPFNWKRAPYQREWLDVCCDDHTQKVVLMTSARVGKTTVLENVTAYFMANDPSAIMWMVPTLGEAERFSMNNLDPMIRDCRVLRDLVKDKRQRDSGNLKLTKRYRGGSLLLVGAESAKALHGKTIRILLCDEVDRYPQSAGKDGDPLQNAIVRTTTFGRRRKVIVSSTPGIKDFSHIEREFQLSDQRYYQIPCPDCGVFQKLTWKNLNYKDNPTSPTYICASCSYAIPEHLKFQLLLRGQWIPENPTSSVVGYHLNALYSVHMSWAELVEEWLKTKNNRFQLQVFINQRLGETWDESSNRVTHHQLELRLESYNAPCPTKDDSCNGVGVITAGVDIQGNRIEMAVYGHGLKDELWLLDVDIIEGDTGTDAPWAKLTDLLLTRRYRTKNGGSLGIFAIAIDSGHNTERVYRYVEAMKRRPNGGRVIIAVKGVENDVRIIGDRPQQSKSYSAQYYRVGTNIAKDHLATLLANPTPGQNYVHLPISFPSEDGQPRYLDNEILKQITSEKPVLTYVKGRPKREWRTTRERNEQWDMMVYAYAALQHLGPKLRNELGKKAEEHALLVETPTETPLDVKTLPDPGQTPNKSGLVLHPGRRSTNRFGPDFWSR